MDKGDGYEERQVSWEMKAAIGSRYSGLAENDQVVIGNRSEFQSGRKGAAKIVDEQSGESEGNS